MKINSNDGIVQTTRPEPAKPGRGPAGAEFGSILKQELERTDPKASAPAQVHGAGNVSEIQFTPAIGGQAAPLVQQAEKLLDIMDHYRQKLINPAVTLREIHPLIQQLETEKAFLASKSDSLPDEDDLKKTLNDVLITASVEIIKFNRGDYVSP